MEKLNNIEVDLTTTLQQKILQVFKFLITFLGENNLRYCVAFGTCLGAIRHHGMIPWDDDIDIYMPREDYEKFLDLRESLNGTKYSIVSLRDKGYYTTYAKLYDTSTTIWERRRWPFLIGVFVDVFPLDSTDVNDEDEYFRRRNIYQKALDNYRNAITKTSFAEYLHLAGHFSVKTLWNRIKCSLYYNHKVDYYYRQLVETSRIYNADGDNCLSVSWPGGYREVLPKRWIEDLIDVKFYDFTVKVPREYDAYLTRIYKNYMQMPPEEQRVQHHNEYYVNLRESLTLKEVKARIAAGRFVEC